VRSDRPSVRPAVRHDHPRRDRHRIPTPRTCHGHREPALAIQGGQELADVDDLGLQFDDQQDPACRVPREDVDDAALAVDREGDLRLRGPARKITEEAGHQFVHPGMARAHQATEIAALPPNDRVQSRIKGGRHGPDLAERYATQAALFDPQDDPAGYPGAHREILLASALPRSDRAEGPADALIVHPRSMPPHPRPTVTRALSAAYQA